MLLHTSHLICKAIARSVVERQAVLEDLSMSFDIFLIVYP